MGRRHTAGGTEQNTVREGVGGSGGQGRHLINGASHLLLLTLGATTLQTIPLGFKVVLVAQTPSVVEEFAAHGGGVVEVVLEKPKAGSRVWSRSAGLCEREAPSVGSTDGAFRRPRRGADLPLPLKKDGSMPEPSSSSGFNAATTFLFFRCSEVETSQLLGGRCESRRACV